MTDSRNRSRGRLRVLATMLRIAWAADRRGSVLAFVLFGLEALAQSLFACWLKLLLDGLNERSLASVTAAALGMAASIAGGTALSYAGSRVQQLLRERAHHFVERRLAEVVGRAPTLDIHETPEHLTQLEALGPEAHGLGQVIPSTIELFATGVRIAVTTLLLLSVHPLLLALPLFGLPALLLSPKTGGMFRLGNELAAEPARLAGHLIELTATAGAAKEIRLFRLGDELLNRFHLAHKEIRRIHHRINVRAAGFGLVAQGAFIIGYFGAIVFVAGQAAQGRASAGDLVLVAVLAGQVIGLVTGSADLLQLALRNLAAAGRVVYLQDISERLAAGVDRDARVPERLAEGIRLENVSYRYPLGQRLAVHDLNVLLPAGSTVAIVGDNGAGKTTLVKLLAGLYRPSNGRITVDGVDLGMLDPARWREHISAAFQDHARFEFLVRETVGIGDLSKLGDENEIRSALARAGASDLLDVLPSGLSTQLGPNWPGGVDLSGGQWQKLAIGRAMMRREPLLLLLDEPTAALDADTEHRLFEAWTAAARHIRQRTGGITVLVSHRFSTVRMADLIIVLRNGMVAEFGDHEELLAAGGLYAELFDLQARSYR